MDLVPSPSQTIGPFFHCYLAAYGTLGNLAGVPAKAIKPLDENDKFLIERKTRPDLPDDL